VGFLDALRRSAAALTTRQALGILLTAFLLSRLVAAAAGLRFDATPLGTYFQFLDPEFLRHDLLRSLYYLHMQPPLFNLALGLGLKAFPESYPLVFQLVYLALGLALNAGLFLLLMRLGISGAVSLALTLLFMCSPASLVYENWLFYSYPLAAWLCLSAFFLHRLLSAPSGFRAFLFFATLAAVVLTRSLFHPAWLLLWVALLLAVLKPHRKTLALAALVPVLLVVGWQAKNAALFGSFSGSTWFGFSFSRVTTFALPEEERRGWVAAGRLSELALIRPFSPLRCYPARGPRPDEPVPALDREVTSTGKANYNHREYIRLSGLYARDAWRVLRDRPETLCSSFQLASFLFFLPSTDYDLLVRPRTALSGWDRLFNLVVLGQFSYHEDVTTGEYVFGNAGLWLALAYLVALGGGLLMLRRAWRAGVPAADPSFLVPLYLLLTILFVAFVGNVMEVGENNRFRFMVDPLALALFAWVLHRAWAARPGAAAASPSAHS
jgi:hypothetical protein